MDYEKLYSPKFVEYMGMDAEVVLEAFKKTRASLDGECSREGTTCPANTILIDLKEIDLMCAICAANFHWIRCGYESQGCPCHREANPDEILLRLDEFIEELEEVVEINIQ